MRRYDRGYFILFFKKKGYSVFFFFDIYKVESFGIDVWCDRRELYIWVLQIIEQFVYLYCFIRYRFELYVISERELSFFFI